MSSVIDKFIRYAKIDTQSKDNMNVIPSTEKQKNLANLLAEELKAMGASDVNISENSYVYATIPANTDKKSPVLGLIAHMDTSPAYSGTDVEPIILKNYDGKDIVMNKETGLTMETAVFPELLDYVGQDLILTDGSTLLGADDKAGVAEIMATAEYFLTHPEVEHGTIKIGFTPDEEVGCGANKFDVAGFGADAAYTMDGGAIGEIEYENFNAAALVVTVHGVSVHPGSSKGRMKNALLMGMEFQNMLPVFDNPMYTEGYEGFYHLDRVEGTVETAVMHYILRDHDIEKLEIKKKTVQKIADFLNEKYGEGTFELSIKDSYYNMLEKIKPHMYLIDIAKDAMKELDIEPKICPIRGGTDGARLSYMGLPCPNLCTGGHNFHGKFEYVPVQSMEKIVDMLVLIVKKFHSYK